MRVRSAAPTLWWAQASEIGEDGRVSAQDDVVRMTAWVHGRVQGVGFRWWVRSTALEIGLTGSANNLADGRVEVVAEGTRGRCERLLNALRSGSTPGHVEQVVERWSESQGGSTGFTER